MLGLAQLQVPYSSRCLGMALSNLRLKFHLFPSWILVLSSSLSGCQPQTCSSGTLSNAPAVAWVCTQEHDEDTKAAGVYIASSWLNSLGSPFWDALVTRSSLLQGWSGLQGGEG